MQTGARQSRYKGHRIRPATHRLDGIVFVGPSKLHRLSCLSVPKHIRLQHQAYAGRACIRVDVRTTVLQLAEVLGVTSRPPQTLLLAAEESEDDGVCEAQVVPMEQAGEAEKRRNTRGVIVPA